MNRKNTYLNKAWKRKEAQELICLCDSMGSVLAKRSTLPFDFWPKLIWLLLGILFPHFAMSARACRGDNQHFLHERHAGFLEGSCCKGFVTFKLPLNPNVLVSSAW